VAQESQEAWPSRASRATGAGCATILSGYSERPTNVAVDGHGAKGPRPVDAGVQQIERGGGPPSFFADGTSVTGWPPSAAAQNRRRRASSKLVGPVESGGARRWRASKRPVRQNVDSARSFESAARQSWVAGDSGLKESVGRIQVRCKGPR